MVEFTCEAIWSWAFVCWKIFDYSFNFHACDGSVKIFNFFLVQFWKVIVFLDLSISSIYPVYWHTVADSSLLWSFVFLCCLLWYLYFHFKFGSFDSSPFFFLMSLANGLSSLFIFSKNQVLVLLIFASLLCLFHLSSQRTRF